jgi:hypothetical protein
MMMTLLSDNFVLGHQLPQYLHFVLLSLLLQVMIISNRLAKSNVLSQTGLCNGLIEIPQMYLEIKCFLANVPVIRSI